MKIAFISRATLYSSPGGDTKQIEQTAAGLRRLGVSVDIYLTGDAIDYSQYDLLHFFNIIRPADIMGHIRKSGKPFVVSTIFVDYEVFEKKNRSGLAGYIGRLLPADMLEYLKALARWVKNGERPGSLSYLWTGHGRAIRQIIRGAALLLPNSHSEYRRLEQKYGVKAAYRVVPNGISLEQLQQPLQEAEQYRGAVLCMARIEGIKNQLRLIRALKNTPYRLFIHGKPSPNHIAYYNQCVAEAAEAENITIGGWLEGEALYAAYKAAKVHVLPSYFETTGLSSLEAAVMGCNIVITEGGDTREYFGDDAWYCDPEDTDSIRQAVEAAYAAPYNEAFRERILRSLTWERAAEETRAAYQQVLGGQTGNF
jgi:glycosyltransferase involved in cell wall biosynthesis